MATIYRLLGIICLIVFGGFTEPSSYFLRIEAEGLGFRGKGLGFDKFKKVETEKVQGLGTMLYFDQNSLSIAKNGRQSSVPVKSKKQLYCRAISTSKPQTQWFCVNVFTAFNFSVANKTKCQCFFDAGGFVKRHLRVIDKHFCILFMPKKCEAFLNTYNNINKGEKLDALRHRAAYKLQFSHTNNSGCGKAKQQLEYLVNPHLTNYTINQLTQRTSVLAIAKSQIGTREATGKNDGAAVEAYLSYTGNKKGEPWCASFVSWVFGKAGFSLPRTAWSPALFPKNRLVSEPMPANVFGIYFSNLKRIAHCGLVEKVKGNWVATIEGNTNISGSREGDGVYRKLRHQRTIALYANWINK